MSWLIRTLFVSIVLAFCDVKVCHAQTPVPPPGSGTAESPFLISTIDHLAWMDSLNFHTNILFFSLQNDIDASQTTNWNGGKGFRPLGQTVFQDVIDGKGHAIRNLFVNRPTETGVAFIGNNYGSIMDLRIENCRMTGSLYVGGLCGSQGSLGTIIRCRVSGFVTGSIAVGGIAGGSSGKMFDSCSQVDVVGHTNVGGLVGNTYYNTIISNCYAAGSTRGITQIGGLIAGQNGLVYDSYSSSSVIGDSNYAGFAWRCTGTIVRCYSTGFVGGPMKTNGFISRMSGGTIVDSFWDTNASDRLTSAGGVGKSTTEMTMGSTFTGWNFESTWGMSTGCYPYLKSFPVLTVSYRATGGGTILGTANQTVNPGARGLPITAVPNPYNRFTRWSDGVTTPSRTDLSITNHYIVTALFTLLHPAVIMIVK